MVKMRASVIGKVGVDLTNQMIVTVIIRVHGLALNRESILYASLDHTSSNILGSSFTVTVPFIASQGPFLRMYNKYRGKEESGLGAEDQN